MRIVLDAMGSDTCPEPEVAAALDAKQRFGDEIILVGPVEQLRARLQALAGENPPVKLVHAPDVITMEDKGLSLALKAKRKEAKTSIAVGIDLVKRGEADAFVTAGNTGGAMATAYYRLGTIEGFERPGLAALFPVKGGDCVVLDIGANPDCKPEHLLQFAIMGAVYARSMLHIQNPRVGLLSNGEEAGKGNELIRGTFPLLESSGLNFVGNLEGKELYGGAADVAVTDGFTGNILLKSSEAVAKLITDTISAEIKNSKSLRTKLGGLLVKPALKGALMKKLDPAEVGAARLIGVNGLVLIGHGRSDARALVSAIRMAREAVQANLMEGLRAAGQEYLKKINQEIA